jgi:hypothetical protein
MNFINLPGRGRRLVVVPAAQLSGEHLMAGYDADLDATAAELPMANADFSLLLILPGQLNEFRAGGLAKLESQLNATRCRFYSSPFRTKSFRANFCP